MTVRVMTVRLVTVKARRERKGGKHKVAMTTRHLVRRLKIFFVLSISGILLASTSSPAPPRRKLSMIRSMFSTV